MSFESEVSYDSVRLSTAGKFNDTGGLRSTGKFNDTGCLRSTAKFRVEFTSEQLEKKGVEEEPDDEQQFLMPSLTPKQVMSYKSESVVLYNVADYTFDDAASEIKSEGSS